MIGFGLLKKGGSASLAARLGREKSIWIPLAYGTEFKYLPRSICRYIYAHNMEKLVETECDSHVNTSNALAFERRAIAA
jgi:hypothetical protein